MKQGILKINHIYIAKQLNHFILNRSFKEEQLSMCVRYTTKQFEVVERFLTFINVSKKQDASSLCSYIFNFLDMNQLSEIPIVAQSYDGASVMSGRIGGVQQKVKIKYPFAYIRTVWHIK